MINEVYVPGHTNLAEENSKKIEYWGYGSPEDATPQNVCVWDKASNQIDHQILWAF
jgi:hypothetical protein